MPTAVRRDDVQRLVEAGGLLVEVLPQGEYDEEHLPGSVSLPLKSLTKESAGQVLDRRHPVIVYCWDAL